MRRPSVRYGLAVPGPSQRCRWRWRLLAVLLAGILAPAAPAGAEVFDGRIAFTSFRATPLAGQERDGDIFSMNADGSDLRRLTPNPERDRQPDWSRNGSAIAYSIRKPGFTTNFEVSRMTAAGAKRRRLTTTATGQASSQPSWSRSGRSLLFRRSGSGRASSIWQMGPLGESPMLRFQPPDPPLYPTWSPNSKRILFAAILSSSGDTDRGIFAVNADGSGLTTLFDVAGAFDSAPAWSPDGRRIAFESDADVGGRNPERDLEIWTMAADGSDVRQLTSNALRDEGPAWSPDGGRRLAYTSGVDDTHGDIHVMTAQGTDIRRLAPFDGLDESPDWQAIPAPDTDRRCGDVKPLGRGVRDVRARGRGLSCARVLALADRWARNGRAREISRFAVRTHFFGGTRRIVMTRRGEGRSQVVAFLHQPQARPER